MIASNSIGAEGKTAIKAALRNNLTLATLKICMRLFGLVCLLFYRAINETIYTNLLHHTKIRLSFLIDLMVEDYLMVVCLYGDNSDNRNS